MAKILVRRRAYVRSDGTHVRAATFKAKDRGTLGRTPKGKRWYRPTVHTGWDKDMAMDRRRRLVLKAHKGAVLAAGRAMQALANVTTDATTKTKARADALYFFRLHKKRVGG